MVLTLPTGLAALIPLAGLTALGMASMTWFRSLIHRYLLVPLGLASQVEVHGPIDESLQKVVRSCPHLVGPQAVFAPSIWLLNGHVHTVYCTRDFSAIDKVSYERHTIRLPDGGTLGLDFATPIRDDAPMLIISHGLTGGSHESYVRSLITALQRDNHDGRGWQACVVNFRGCAGVEVTSEKLYHAGQTDDLRSAILYIRHRFPKITGLYGAGFSLGANSLGKYLGEEGDKTPLKGAALFGCPWSLHAGHVSLESSFMGRLYSRAMCSNLRRMLKRHEKVFKSSTIIDWNDTYANPSASLYEFDSVFTRTLGGFRSTEHYYKSQSSSAYLDGVRIPVLAFHAKDDGIASVSTAPFETTNPFVAFAVTKHGGHLGWFEGLYPQRWIHKPAVEWFNALEATPKGSKSVGAQKAGSQEPVAIGHTVRQSDTVGFELVRVSELTGGSEGETTIANGTIKGL